ncbi:MAG: hypothetical protein ACLRZN_05385 [Dialister invisus]
MRRSPALSPIRQARPFLLSCFWRRHEAERVHFMEVLLALLLLSALAAAVFRFSGRRREPWHLWTGGGGQ